MWKKLTKLHNANIAVVIFLYVTGILLAIPFLRGMIADVRVPFKNFHIFIGFVSIVLLIMYYRYFQFHYKTVKKQNAKKFNLWFVITFTIGWIASGLILTFHRSFPALANQSALFIHNILTWVGLPFIVYHSITRAKWVRKQLLNKNNSQPSLFNFSRKGFIKYGITSLLVILVGPTVYRWMKQFLDPGGQVLADVVRRDKNKMNPLPTPAPASNPPVGGGYKGNFRVYTVTDIPKYKNDNWSFTIDGLVEEPVTLSWEEFITMKRVVQVSDFYCVTGWSVFSVTYEGILLKDLLKKVNFTNKATHLKFYSGDGVYTDCLSLEQAHMDDVMVALLMDGYPIPSDYGGPARLIVPKMYAYKAVKWLVRIEAIDHEHLGYWQVRGYDTNAWVHGKQS
ncbi:molybdopterin-dependent oxidoreductase [Bacillus salinus]|uniref:molybdopterin-dependent oxidoreductase n=1 Tax=Bacillus sp. HMF5848 TaxID=2495421 RepID=UPI0021ADA74A|nr:molybdopterin-dependent oxidoreductase [Bacillus sp. HMF5848]